MRERTHWFGVALQGEVVCPFYVLWNTGAAAATSYGMAYSFFSSLSLSLGCYLSLTQHSGPSKLTSSIPRSCCALLRQDSVHLLDSVTSQFSSHPLKPSLEMQCLSSSETQCLSSSKMQCLSSSEMQCLHDYWWSPSQEVLNWPAILFVHGAGTRVDRGFAEDSKTSRSSKCSAIGNRFGCTVFTRTSTTSCIEVQTWAGVYQSPALIAHNSLQMDTDAVDSFWLCWWDQQSHCPSCWSWSRHVEADKMFRTVWLNLYTNALRAALADGPTI